MLKCMITVQWRLGTRLDGKLHRHTDTQKQTHKYTHTHTHTLVDFIVVFMNDLSDPGVVGVQVLWPFCPSIHHQHRQLANIAVCV